MGACYPTKGVWVKPRQIILFPSEPLKFPRILLPGCLGGIVVTRTDLPSTSLKVSSMFRRAALEIPAVQHHLSTLSTALSHPKHRSIVSVQSHPSSTMVQRNTSDDWTGPTVRQMVDTHTLAKEVIDRHNDPCPVFDDKAILQLRRFVQDPAQVEKLIQELDSADGGAWRSGGLTALIMTTWGTDKSYLTQDEVVSLKEWFANGGGKTDEEVKAENQG